MDGVERRGTLTHFSLQQAMCELEGGAGCVLFPCGAAAVANSILAFVEQGDHVLMTNTAYEPSQDFCSKILSKLGVTTSWFDPLIGADIVKHLQPNTKIVFLESPGSITMEVHDVPAIVAAVRSVVPDAIIMIDNTWAAGVLFKALDFGIDVSIQAATKYLVGHSDAMIGTAVCRCDDWHCGVQCPLLGAAARECLSDGPDGRCRYRLYNQPWPAHIRCAFAPTS